MHLQTITRRLSAFGLISALALVLAFAGGSLASAQDVPATPATEATPALGGDTALPDTGAGTTASNQSTPAAATPAVGGDTALPDTGAGTTANLQATPAVGGDTTLPSTGTGDASQTGFGGLMIVLAAAAAVVVAAVSARTFSRRSN